VAAGAVPLVAVLLSLTCVATARADAPTPAATAQAAPAGLPDPEILPVMHGWVAVDLGGGVCARPSYAQPCASQGIVPEAALALVAVDVLDAHVSLEWRLAVFVGLTDSIGNARNNPLRTMIGLFGEMGFRVEPTSGWYLAF